MDSLRVCHLLLSQKFRVKYADICIILWPESDLLILAGMFMLEELFSYTFTPLHPPLPVTSFSLASLIMYSPPFSPNTGQREGN